MDRIRHTQIKDTRNALLTKQCGICPLCGKTIDPENAVLDHDHHDGKIRATLHNGCNRLLGRIESNAPRNLVTDVPAFLRNAAVYLEKPSLDIYHPTWRTEEEKRLLRNKRARIRSRRRRMELGN